MITFDAITKKEINKEDIKSHIKQYGFWRGFSLEYGMDSYNQYDICKLGNGFSVRVSCAGYILIFDRPKTFNDAYMALDELDSTLNRMSRKMEIITE